MTPASPLPWKAVEEYPEDSHSEEGTCWRIEPVTLDDGMAYGYRWLRKQDARYIVMACNAYPELLEMARDLAATKDETDLGVCGELLSDLADRAVKVLWTIAKEATHGR